MLTLRDYQVDLRDRARQAIARGVRRILIQSATGSGKTCLVANMLHGAASRGKRSWFVVHRKELLEQSVQTFVEAADIHTGIIAAGYPSAPLAPVQVCSIGSLKRRARQHKPPDMIVWDECFVSGTMIGDKPIEQIKVGDTVATWNEEFGQFDTRQVLCTHRRVAPGLLFQITVEGKQVVCTAGHPFLTSNGWRHADELQKGDYLHGLRIVRWPDEENEEPLSEMSSVLSRFNGRPQSVGSSRANAQIQSNAARVQQRKNEIDTKGHWAQTARAWWQWAADACSGSLAGLRAWMEYGSLRPSAECESSGAFNALQNRYWQQAFDGRRGSGRWFTLLAQSSGSRQKERCVSVFRRVDSIEVLERGSDGRFEQVCRDGFVYNFETERTHTYIANDLIVHNCHHQASNSWSAIAAMFPSALHIGLTATPQRLDGRGLASYFDELICGPSTAALIESGHLSRYTLYAPPTALDLSKVRRVAGDYNKHDVSDQMEGSTVVGDAVSHYRQHCAGARALVFAWSLEASRRITEQFVAAGVPASHVDGETPRFERGAAMGAFRDGSTRVLCNVDLFGEGLDVPAVDAVFLLRPTQSLGLYLQQVGRGLRPYPGKAEVKIFDHVNNWERHGLPDDAREWKLEGREKKSRESSVAMGRRCDQCFGVSPIGSVKCRYCGKVFPVQQRTVEQVEGTLKATDPAVLRAYRDEWKAQIKYAQTQKDFRRIADALGYKPGWAWHMSFRRREMARAQAAGKMYET